jgi:uncharacterized protein (TIGR00369 family)
MAGRNPEMPQDPDFATRIEASFAKQGLMVTMGAMLGKIAPGHVSIILPVVSDVSQQHGFVHAGAVAAIADSAAGYAALSLMPRGAGVLTTEFKINLMAPAVGDRLVAEGRVIRAGRSLTVAMAEVFAETGFFAETGNGEGAARKLIALLTASMMTITGRDGISD